MGSALTRSAQHRSSVSLVTCAEAPNMAQRLDRLNRSAEIAEESNKRLVVRGELIGWHRTLIPTRAVTKLAHGSKIPDIN